MRCEPSLIISLGKPLDNAQDLSVYIDSLSVCAAVIENNRPDGMFLSRITTKNEVIYDR